MCCVQAIEAEASYKACIQAANSAREQLDHVKVYLWKFQSAIVFWACNITTNFMCCIRLCYLTKVHLFWQKNILRGVRELLKESDKVLKLVMKLMSFVFLDSFVSALNCAALHYFVFVVRTLFHDIPSELVPHWVDTQVTWYQSLRKM